MESRWIPFAAGLVMLAILWLFWVAMPGGTAPVELGEPGARGVPRPVPSTTSVPEPAPAPDPVAASASAPPAPEVPGLPAARAHFEDTLGLDVPAWLVVTVEHPGERTMVDVRGDCVLGVNDAGLPRWPDGHYSMSAAAGRALLPVGEGECRVQASRHDGPVRAWSEVAQTDVEPGPNALTVTLPAQRQVSVGLDVRTHLDGVEVVSAAPGSPAEEADLRPRDLVLEIDGVEAIDLSAEEVDQALAGDPGSDVELVVRRQGEGIDIVVLERRSDE